MSNLLFSAATLLTGLTVQAGILSQYAAGVMEPTVEARQEWGQLPQDLSYVEGFIAVWDCERIGDVVWLSVDGSAFVPVMVADCSGHVSTTQWMKANNVLAEISGELAERYDVVCLCPVDGQLVWINED